MAEETGERFRDRFKWKKVEAPRAWRPTVPQQELVGFYAGRSKRNGRFGQYEVVLVAVPGAGVRMISGVKIIQLMDAADIEPGQPVRIVWNGDQALKDDKTMKCFDLYIADGERLPAEDLPAIHHEEG